MKPGSRVSASLCLALVLLCADNVISPVHAQFVQQGNKLIGSGGIGGGTQGIAVGISDDGNTAVVGAQSDNNGEGAAWVFTRTHGIWKQQGGKLFGGGGVGPSLQGSSVAISGDGNTILVGGCNDDDLTGAVWVFVRSGETWVQQGPKLVGTGATYKSSQGSSVAISDDGNTALVGAVGDSGYIGGAWVFVRTGEVWTQQGPKLVGTGHSGEAYQGGEVDLSGDGNTAVINGSADSTEIGAVWVFVRNGETWSQQGGKLIGSGGVGIQGQGASVSISADGNTIISGGSEDNGLTGAAWVFTRTDTDWAQLGEKLVPSDVGYHARFGGSASLSDDGNTAIIAGPGNESEKGAIWVFKRNDSGWTQYGTRLVGTDGSWNALQGMSVELSGNATTALSGGPMDNARIGATWVFVDKSLEISVVDPETPEPPGRGGMVHLYDSSGRLVESSPTDSLSMATFYAIAPGSGYSCVVEWPVEDSTMFIDTLYWGRKQSMQLVSGQTSHDTCIHNSPRIDSLSVVEARTLGRVTGQTVLAGFPLVLELAVRNPEEPEATPAMVRGRFLLRKDTTSGYAIDLQSPQIVLPTRGADIVTSVFTPVDTGAYYAAAGVLTDVRGSDKHSDAVEYRDEPLFTVAWPQLPDSPALISPVANSTGQPVDLQFRWQSVPITVKYNLQVATDSTFSSGLVRVDTSLADTVCAVEGLPFFSELYWRVQGTNIAGEGPWSSVWRVRTLEQIPAIPELTLPVNGAQGLDTTVTLSWIRPTGATVFVLQVATDSLFSPGSGVCEVEIADTFAVLHALDYADSYWWRVKARRDSSEFSPFAVPWAFTVGLPLPGSVVLIAPVQDAVIQSDSLQLVWTSSVPHVTRYWLEYGIDTAFVVKATDSLLTDTSTVLTGMLKGTQYYWRVRAGNASGWGEFSGVQRFHRSTTSAPGEGSGIPDTWTLEQNFPNPFNPSTTIRYGLPVRAHVTISVINTLGQQITMLRQGEEDAGYHHVTLDASGLPSGMYFYRLHARSLTPAGGSHASGSSAEYVQTRKLLLLK